MIIVMDLDNTLALTDKAVCKVYNDNTGENVDYTKVKEWYYSDVIKKWTRDEINNVFIQQEFFDNLEPIQGMYELLKNMQEKGHIIKIASVHRSEGVEMKKNWIRKHFDFIEEKNINILTGIDLKTGDIIMDKSTIEGDIMVDDHMDNLKTCKCKYKIMYGDYGYQPKEKNIEGVDIRVYNPIELGYVFNILENCEVKCNNGKAIF